MGDRGRVPVRLLVVAAVVLLSVQGCRLFKPNPTPPATPLIPTMVGVVDHMDITATARVYTLSDGRTLSDAFADEAPVQGGAGNPGNLLLARTSGPRFIDFLSPMGDDNPGCWDPWYAGVEGDIVWGMGDSLLFISGLELTKAPAFHSNAITEDMDGRTTWSRGTNMGGKICVNRSGQVDWILNPVRGTG